MSKFTEKVSELLKRLSGKDPDEKAQKEIGDLEKTLSDENSKQINELTTSLKGLTGRLEKLEKPAPDPATGATGAGNKSDEITASLKKIEERIEAVEKGIAKSQQPGETTNPQARTDNKKDVFAGTIFPPTL